MIGGVSPGRYESAKWSDEIMSKTLAGLLAIAISVALFVSPAGAEKFVFAWTAVSWLTYGPALSVVDRLAVKLE
jgi:hypothetical protein